MKRIEIRITPSGETKIETKGFAGKTCQEASRLLESALGKRQHEQLTGEFYTTESNTHSETQKEG